ncbi:MAG: flagellar FliJ family protein [Opitutales bacterium]|nr:flagellar FliJ family protein [Opitutales bacterium]NRA26884.1 flagellar FliJ family protein [Opitutales bacterium]
MRRFNFKLQGFLSLKSNAEEKALDAYARSMQERQLVEQRLDDLKNFFVMTQKQQVERREHGMDAWQFQHDFVALASIRDEIQETENALKEALDKEAAFRTEFLNAKAEREMVDRLRQKKEDEFYEEMRRREELELEEIAMTRHARTAGSQA